MLAADTKHGVPLPIWQIAVAVSLLLLDQLSKAWVHFSLPVADRLFSAYPYGGIGVFRNLAGVELSITHMTNTGAAWGVLGGYQLPLLILRLILILGLCFYLTRMNRQPAWRLPLLLIIAGAAGNVLDFFTYGHVIDMLHVVIGNYDFPVFNLADSAISVGAAVLLFLSWFTPSKSPSIL